MTTATTTAAAASSVLHSGSGQTRLRDLRTTRDFADAAGVALPTIAAYRSRGYLPEPIGNVDGKPVWSRAQVEEWYRKRPGQGKARPEVAAAAAAVAELIAANAAARTLGTTETR